MLDQRQVRVRVRRTILAGLLFLSVVQSAWALDVTNPVSLGSVFPKTTQGENGIWMQGRLVGTSTYTDLINVGDYNWKLYPNDTTWPGAPHIYNSNIIRAIPSFAHLWNGNETGDPNMDAIVRVQIEGNVSAVVLYGSTSPEASNYWTYIYKGADNWSNPIWTSSYEWQLINLEIPVSAGDELFIGTHRSDFNSCNFGGQDPGWGLTLTGIVVPEPGTLSLLTAALLGIGTISFMRRSSLKFRGRLT
jgi:hypothetical protein